MWSAAELIELYESEGPRIFDRDLFRTLSTVFALEDENYPQPSPTRRSAGLRECIWPHTPILNVIFDGVSDTVDYQLTQVLDEGLYFRFQPKLDQSPGST